MAYPTVSIALATYNGEKFLREQLESFSSQTLTPYELVVCDDGSRDGTLAILSAYAAEARFPVRIIKNDVNLGYSANFAKAASLCKGDIIFFSDQDDIWFDDKIELMTKHLVETGDYAVTHNFSVKYHDGREAILSFDEYLKLSGLPPAYNIHGCCIAFPRSVIEKCGWADPPSSSAHDRWILLIATLFGRRGCIAKPLMARRIHGENVAGGWVPGGDRLFRRLFRKLRLPPFTSNDDLNLHIAHWVAAPGLASSKKLVWKLTDDLPAGVASRALTGMDCNERMRSFVLGPTYKTPLARTARAIYLFCTLNYRFSDGFQGFFLDLLGRRDSYD